MELIEFPTMGRQLGSSELRMNPLLAQDYGIINYASVFHIAILSSPHCPLSLPSVLTVKT